MTKIIYEFVPQPVALFTAELTRALPQTLQSSLPSVEDIEQELKGDES